MTTADDLPNDVVERASEATHLGSKTYVRSLLALLLDADPPIVALVPDPDTDAIEALAGVLGCGLGWANETQSRLEREGFTVARLTDVQRREPCPTCGGDIVALAANPCRDRTCGECVSCMGPCPTCGVSGERPANPQVIPKPMNETTYDAIYDEGFRAGYDARRRECKTIHADPQHDHDVNRCPACRDTMLYGMDEARSDAATPPPAGDLPGDGSVTRYENPPGTPLPVNALGHGWVRWLVNDDGHLCLEENDSAFGKVHENPHRFELYPDPETEPRPTDGWEPAYEQVDNGPAAGWCTWDHYDAYGNLIPGGVESTREEAEQAAAQARAAWDARLAGGAS